MENENTRFNIYKNKSYFFRQPEIKMVHIQIIINFLNLCYYCFHKITIFSQISKLGNITLGIFIKQN